MLLKVASHLIGNKLTRPVHGPKDASGKREELLHAGRRVTASVYEQLTKHGLQEIEVDPIDLMGAFSVTDVASPVDGVILAEANTTVVVEPGWQAHTAAEVSSRGFCGCGLEKCQLLLRTPPERVSIR